MIYGPSHSGKTQAAMVARALIDPDQDASFHTSAAILNTNTTVRIADRSATWQTWTELSEAVERDRLPKLLIIDEAGSSACPSQPFDFSMLRSKHLLQKFIDAGTKFIVIGHDDRPGNLTKWAEWLSGARGEYGALSPGREPTIRMVPKVDTEAAHQRGDNPVAKKNEVGAEGRGTMRTPPGNAAFFRGSSWSKDQD